MMNASERRRHETGIDDERDHNRHHHRQPGYRSPAHGRGLGRRAAQLIPELVADDYVGHLPIGDHYGPEGLRIDIAAHRAAFPDLALRIDDLFASGDRVVRRYTLRGTLTRPLPGRAVTGKEPVTLRQIAIDRLADGRLLESWIVGIVPGARTRRPGRRSAGMIAIA